MEDTVRPGRRLPDGSYRQPVALMLANLTRPTAERPSLLRHAELITLFHEFRHYRTGVPIPDKLLAGLIASRYAASGVLTLQDRSRATLDLAYHSAGYGGDSTATLAEVYAQHGLRHIEGTHLQSGFIHLFGYDAAYYGYLWSQVMGDDMYTRFETAGPLDPATGAAYRRTVLERGGTVEANLMVRDFLGREPSSAAFLRWIGLAIQE